MKSCATSQFVNPRNCEPCEVYHADHVIVGLGTAGSILAWGLSNNKCLDVFAIEAGVDQSKSPAVLDPNPFNPTLTNDQRYHLTYPWLPSPTAFLTAWQFGRMWAGSSGHNLGLHVRGTPTPYNAWGAINPRWLYANLLPYMKALETYTAVITGVVNAAQRGTAGPIKTSQINYGTAPLDPAGDLAIALGAAAFAPYTVDYNDYTLGQWVSGDDQNYADPVTAERSYAGNAILTTSVVERKENGDGIGVNGRQLRISSNSTVFELLVDRGIKRCGKYCETPRVYGVRYIKDGRIYEVRARKKVHLSAGAIEDAILLQRAGIGDGAALTALGIDVVVDNPNVGANVQNHYGPAVNLPLQDPADPDLPAGFATFVSFFDLRGANVGAGSGVREYMAAASIINPGAPADGLIQMLCWNLRPARVGTVKLQDPAFPSSPLVETNAWTDPGDLAAGVKMLKVAANLSIAYSGAMPISPGAAIYPAPYPGGLAPDDSQLEAYLLTQTALINCTAHLSGSARMSVDATTGVVDGNLDVHGVKGLSVVSNAAVPTIQDGNTTWQAYVLGAVKAEIEKGKVL